MPRLHDPSLLKNLALIDGQWCAATEGATLPVRNPATGELIGHIPNIGAAQTQLAIDAAERAFASWKLRTAEDRATLLKRWHALMVANADDLALLMTAEQGKPLAEAKGEIAYAASYIEWFAEEARRIYGEVIPSPWPDKRIVVTREPVGVCAAITPWNFPSAMITRKVAPALAAGCTIIVKPATQTPLSALAMAELAQRAGIPAGVFNVITGDARPIGGVLTASPTVRKLTFTGSTEVGRVLAAQCAPTLKRMSLELGGNAPFIVFNDADLDAAVAGAMASKYRNTGQTCVCSNRFLVQDGVYDAFAAKLGQAVAALKVGNGLDAGVTQGPLIDAPAPGQSAGTGGRCRGKGGHGGGRRPAPRPGWHVLRTHRADQRDTGHARGPGRNFRARVATVPFQHRAGSRANGQRHRIRPGRVFLFTRRGSRLARERRAGVRHGGRELRCHFHRRGPVRRCQAVGHGPRRLAARHRRIRGHQIRVHGRGLIRVQHSRTDPAQSNPSYPAQPS